MVSKEGTLDISIIVESIKVLHLVWCVRNRYPLIMGSCHQVSVRFWKCSRTTEVS